MSFGFSVGDFLAVIELVHDLAVALSDGRGSGAKFQGLVQELYSLERAMIEIKNLQVPASLESHLWMVQQASSQCQRAITNFLRKSSAYFRCLGQGGSSRWWKDAFYKIKWAAYKPDDVDELRACLRGHVTAMGIMLQVLQIQTMKATMAEMEHQLQTRVPLDLSSMRQFVSSMQTNLMQEMNKAISEMTDTQTQSNAELHTTMMQILHLTLQTYQMMSQAQTEVPNQVMRQQPVYLEDARGVLAPFHLEFVTSFDVLIYALKNRYSERGALKVEQHKFAITDAKTKRDIDFSREWKRCFRPGQWVNMSLFFDEISGKTTACPSCRSDCPLESHDIETECPNCGVIFRRIEILSDNGTSDSTTHPNNGSRGAGIAKHNGDASSMAKQGENNSAHAPSSSGHESDDEDDGEFDDEMLEYKRIRLFNDGAIRWNPLACSRGLRISNNGLGVIRSSAGPPLLDDSAYLFVTATKPLGCAANLQEKTESCFEVRILSGEVCLGFFAEKDPVKNPPCPDSAALYACTNDGRDSPQSRPNFSPERAFRPGLTVQCGVFGGRCYINLSERFTYTTVINHEHRYTPLYPIVGLRGSGRVVARFRGRPFLPTPPERPFKCNECTMAFIRNYDLKRHQRKHLPYKPFLCIDCHKEFSMKDALTEHRLVKGCEDPATPVVPPSSPGPDDISSNSSYHDVDVPFFQFEPS